jgi:hypothetical protein
VLERFFDDARADLGDAHSHWFVFILGHGGQPHQVCPDEDEGIAGEGGWCRRDCDGLVWMPMAGLSSALAGHHALTGRRVRLVYFQNCAKAVLSTLHASKDCAEHVLASQSILGAPNDYYSRLVEWLVDGLGSSDDGSELGELVARKIVDFEDPCQFGALACFRTSAVPTYLHALDDFFSHAASAISSACSSGDVSPEPLVKVQRPCSTSHFRIRITLPPQKFCLIALFAAPSRRPKRISDQLPRRRQRGPLRGCAGCSSAGL